MAFVTEKEELKPGLIIFRRGDVDHRMWYCRMKMPKADRYKTVSLKIPNKEAACEHDQARRPRVAGHGGVGVAATGSGRYQGGRDAR